MEMRDEYIKNFYNDVCEKIDGDYKIILEPNRKLNEDWIEYDKVKWELEDNLEDLVNELLQNKQLSFEKKILEVYKFICLNYIYDDNVLYFFKKDTSDPENIKYIAVDWYGRIVDEKWKNNRKKHNRRICYEFARFYAKAINVLLDGDENLEAFMLGDKENTHYVTVLTGRDYSVILDLDDFNKIKDLTRLKLGLTINGITILRDEKGIFQKAINEFNDGRLSDIIDVQKVKKQFNENNKIECFKKIADILKTYNIDSQGFMEYMRTIVENEGFEIEKIWKEIKGENEKRYVRCIIFEYKGKTYLIDSVEQSLNEANMDELKKLFVFNPQENLYNYYGG
ncbi:MAG: hypothetical protein ILA02_01720 [Clostridia bacterium]|nr:hypothetical protein [Clostridia bacterium]